jgi:hypothetical protein
MSPLPLRGVIAPAFLALAIAAVVLDLRPHSSGLIWLTLLFLALVLVFARDTSRLLSNAFKDADDP